MNTEGKAFVLGTVLGAFLVLVMSQGCRAFSDQHDGARARGQTEVLAPWLEQIDRRVTDLEGRCR